VRRSARFSITLCASLCLVFACSPQPCGGRVPGRVGEPSVFEYAGEDGSVRLKLLGADGDCRLVMTSVGQGPQYERCVLIATARLRMTTDGGATKNRSPDEPRVVFSVLTDRGAILVTRTIGNDGVELRGSKESNLVEGTVTVTMDLSPDQAKRVTAVQAHWATH
jgi:hypothetical protein